MKLIRCPKVTKFIRGNTVKSIFLRSNYPKNYIIVIIIITIIIIIIIIKYKMTKIKSAIKLYSNDDSTMRLVRAFEENAAHQGTSRSSKRQERLQRNWGSLLT